MKRWKKIIENCPYLVALLIMWLFLTIGGIGLMIYRDYGGWDWKTFCSNPFFAIVAEEEMRESSVRSSRAEPAMAVLGREHLVVSNNILEKIETQVIDVAEVEEEKSITVGKTVFETYPPVETNSIYYTDAGKVALTTEYPYITVGDEYFDDAAFLGDSRTMGISDYSGLNADFYCENGMTIYKLLDEKGVTYQKTGEKVNLNQVMQQKQYGKIYIMLGMNELGYRDTNYFLERYREVLSQIRQWQPQAIIFLMANLHVSQEKNNIQTEFNNININSKNVAAATLADGINVFYLDSNPLFTDENGLLKDDITFDGVHLYANNYLEWKTFLAQHGIIRDERNEADNG
ncbi:MAG: GDSL-type esterase/lipase family protein [Bacillus sp. (in: Bacteria)]|nr:GDSL-type esterase/lipase family protein [Bacillus sp. (in: firmicutes)]MCM1427876.1 GDSL-type esterase/lipase family protein [Eubacterium sp.]